MAAEYYGNDFVMGQGRHCKPVEAEMEDAFLETLYGLEVAALVMVTVLNGEILVEKLVEDVILLK